ncbi:hypothetical protein [Coralloluteibacterium stylophorae]|uniref:Uncharacterized protein n=1 Tax=Coralloluteibacterium stylophorae TaxID=1776034 RepID=A0A8J7VQ40_9GAMM|nr:hypothetical protein [Coralloluteibacterium stylophorae]MBS7457301.1 hypothetical protein [Coralloluteibacterium stylophorae]
MRLGKALMAIALMMPVAALADPPVAQYQVLRRTAASLHLDDPEGDAQRSVSEGDTRFIGITDYSCHPPGRHGTRLEALVELHGLRCLAGTSDALESAEHAQLQRELSVYGIAYNRALMKLLTAD